MRKKQTVLSKKAGIVLAVILAGISLPLLNWRASVLVVIAFSLGTFVLEHWALLLEEHLESQQSQFRHDLELDVRKWLERYESELREKERVRYWADFKEGSSSSDSKSQFWRDQCELLQTQNSELRRALITAEDSELCSTHEIAKICPVCKG